MNRLASVLTVIVVVAATTQIFVTRRVVEVVDPQGKPIAGAMVEPISLSINFAKLSTDKNGSVTLPNFTAQEIKWVSVTKPGYQSTGHQQLPQRWPWKITLQPAVAAPKP